MPFSKREKNNTVTIIIKSDRFELGQTILISRIFSSADLLTIFYYNFTAYYSHEYDLFHLFLKITIEINLSVKFGKSLLLHILRSDTCFKTVLASRQFQFLFFGYEQFSVSENKNIGTGWNPYSFSPEVSREQIFMTNFPSNNICLIVTVKLSS